MVDIVGDARPDSAALEQMRASGGDWYAYRNCAFDSATFGHLQFLKCGEDCTFKAPPDRMPDTSSGFGWRYLLVGKVDLEGGGIISLAAAKGQE